MSNKKPHYLFKLRAIVDYSGEALDGVNETLQALTGAKISIRTDDPVDVCVMRADVTEELPEENLEELKEHFIEATTAAFKERSFKLSRIKVDIERKGV